MSATVPGAGDPRLERLRTICLALPEAVENWGLGDPSFRVRDKIFAMYMVNHHGDGRLALWCKAEPGLQQELVRSNPGRFFVPPYVGHHGWVGLRLEGEVDWDGIAELVEDSYRRTAPKRLVARLDTR